MARNRRRLVALAVVLVSLAFAVVIAGIVAAFFFLRSSRTTEITLAATAVGVPTGLVTTRKIGSAGGSLVSADGRVTVIVPANGVNDPVEFIIQPITNQARGGSGNAYRLEPDGQKFSKPVEVIFKYDDQDLEGSAADFFAVASQDENGAWHQEGSTKLDRAARTLTIHTAHFSDWAFMKRLYVSPAKATLRVGETLSIGLEGCESASNEYRLAKFFGAEVACEVADENGLVHYFPGNWYADVGTIDNPHSIRFLYTAPSKKPTPNTAVITFPYQLNGYGDDHSQVRTMFISRITIIDRGYRASGSAGGDTVFSGVICDLEKTFTLKTTNPFMPSVDFVPTSSSTGTWRFTYIGGVGGGGGGQYKIEGLDGNNAAIIMQGSATARVPYASGTGGGEIRLILTPLELTEGWCRE